MSGIQSSVGLITGINIQDTVDQLIAVSSRPRDLLVSRVARLSSQQVAIKELTALVASLELSVNQFGEDSLYNARSISSSHPDLLSFVKTGTPALGSYQFTPIRKASTHQLLSQRFSNDDTPLGEGSLSFQFGGHLDDTVNLDELNGGAGVQRGQIRITDRSGASATIDLRYAFDVDDVLEAINNSTSINVTATTQGDQLVLTDNTGQSLSNLTVSDIGNGSTAADLGLANIDVAANSATGEDIVYLGEDTFLSSLNNGNGVGFRAGVSDLSIDFGSGGEIEVDFENESTIGDILETLNNVSPSQLEARISADGDRIELVDLTGGGSITATNINGSTVLEDLGLTPAASGGLITGTRIQAGLKTSLLSRLSGGNGIADLGTINITDRAGNSETIDLTGAETLDEVISILNSASTAQISVTINEARNGLEIRDESGGSGNLIVANSGDGSTTADKLKIAGDVAEENIIGDSLDLQIIGSSTRLDTLNSGDGIYQGSFVITDSTGNAGAINFVVSSIDTVGDLIDEINSLSIGVEARINDSGTGIVLEDTAGGTGTLNVTDTGNSTSAADLGIAGDAEAGIIEGSFRSNIEIDDDDTLDDLVEKINEATGGATASKIFDGVGYRIAINSNVSGKQGELLLDSLTSGIEFEEIASAEDSLLVYGTVSESSLGVIVSSNDNTFDQLVSGLSINIENASTQAVGIDVGEDDQPIIDNVKSFVEQFNAIIEKVQDLRSFNSNESEDDLRIQTGVLFGTSTLLKVENALNDIATDRVFFAGDFQSLGELGIDFDGDTGKLDLDEEAFQAALESNHEGVIDFLRTETHGLTDRFKATIEQISGEDNSILGNRDSTLQRKIDSLNDRIERKDEQLERERARLLSKFYSLESTIQKIQSSQVSIAQIQPIQPIRISRPTI